MTKQALYSEAKQKMGKLAVKEVESIAREIGAKPEWILAVMKHESNFNPQAENSIGCVGLIQFCPITYRDKWKMDKNYIKNMSAQKQMSLVRKYYKAWHNIYGDFDDPAKLMAVTFYPLMLKHWNENNWVLGSQNGTEATVARQNPGFDLNKNGKITVGEVKQYYATSPIFRDLIPDKQKNQMIKANSNKKQLLWISLFVIITIAFGIGVLFVLRPAK